MHLVQNYNCFFNAQFTITVSSDADGISERLCVLLHCAVVRSHGNRETIGKLLFGELKVQSIFLFNLYLTG